MKGVGGGFNRGVWTRADRGRVGQIEKNTKTYPVDPGGEGLGRIRTLLPQPAEEGGELGQPQVSSEAGPKTG